MGRLELLVTLAVLTAGGFFLLSVYSSRDSLDTTAATNRDFADERRLRSFESSITEDGPGDPHRGSPGGSGKAGDRTARRGGEVGARPAREAGDTVHRTGRGTGGTKSKRRPGALAGWPTQGLRQETNSAVRKRGEGPAHSSAKARLQDGTDRRDLVDFLAERPPEHALALGFEEQEEEDLLFSLPLSDDKEASALPIAEEGILSTEGGTKFDGDSLLVFPDAGNAQGEAGTITFEVTPDWEGSDQEHQVLAMIANRDQGNNTIRVFKNGVYLRFLITDADGQETDISTRVDSWQGGESHTVTATWGEAEAALYLDGNLAGKNQYSGTLEVQPGTPLYIGSSHLPGAGAQASLRDFKIYSRALAPGETVDGEAEPQ